MIRLSLFIVFQFLFCDLFSQNKLVILDSLTHQPLVGVSFKAFQSKLYLHSDLDGQVLFPANLPVNDSIIVSMLGYESLIYLSNLLPTQILLSPKKYLLREAIIKPVEPKEYILRSFDSFKQNHVPFPYQQQVFYREEFIVNDAYLRFQEMDMTIYQFPKNNDSRKYYISGSYPKVNQMYRIDDYKQMADVKASLGKLVSSSFNFNYLSMYSYTKGVNIMNFIFTTLLEDKEIKYTYLGTENIKGYQAMHIQGDHYEGKNLKYSSHIFLEENSYAVIHFSLLASDYDISKKYLDFKTKAALWLLGIRFKVKKYYTKIQFQRTKEGIWAVEDFMTMVPLEVKKKKLLDGYMNISYRMSPMIEKSPIPFSSEIYQHNQFLFDNYKSSSRFGDKLSYSIPLVPKQRERLGRVGK